MAINYKWSDPRFNRHRCWTCFEDLTNKLSIGGFGNKCVQCYCKFAKLDEEHFRKGIANRRCSKCSWDLAIEPAIIEIESGILQGLVCFRCRWGQDSVSDEANEREFQTKKQLYVIEYVEWQNDCAKQEADWHSQFEKKYGEWESQFCVQWRTQQEKRNKIIRFVPSWIKKILFLPSNEYAVPASPKKGPPPPKLSPPIEPLRKAQALCECPELLFDCNKDADLKPQFTHYYPLEFFGFKIGDPPDWRGRSRKCKERDHFRCILCGASGARNICAAHHIIPKSEGGSHSLQNLVTLCSDCHYKQRYYGHHKKIAISLEYRSEKPRSKLKNKDLNRTSEHAKQLWLNLDGEGGYSQAT